MNTCCSIIRRPFPRGPIANCTFSHHPAYATPYSSHAVLQMCHFNLVWTSEDSGFYDFIVSSLVKYKEDEKFPYWIRMSPHKTLFFCNSASARVIALPSSTYSVVKSCCRLYSSMEPRQTRDWKSSPWIQLKAAPLSGYHYCLPT